MLTDRKIRAAKPDEESKRLPDGRGLNLRIYPNGRKAWEFRFRFGDEQSTLDLGDYGAGAGERTLADARSEAQRLRDLLRVGVDPREARRGEFASTGGPLTSEVVEQWYRLTIAGKFRRPKQVRVLLDRHVLPQIGAQPMPELKRGDLFMLVAGIMDGSGNHGRAAPRVAGQTLQYLKRIFAYAVSAGILETNPAEGIKGKDIGLVRKPRDRNLSFAELSTFARWLWSAACFASLVVRALLQILLLTGCRTGEALGAKWDHVDLRAGIWTVPPGDAERRAKSAREHVIHLSEQAKAIFAALPRFSITDADGKLRPSPWVFASPLDPARPIDQKAAARVVRRAFDTDRRKPSKEWRPVEKGRGSRSKLPEVAPLAGIAEFSPHDLRRTFRSRLADLGVAPHVAEKCLNHELGGVLAVYDRGEYLQERKKAFDLWGRKITALLADETATVVEFPAKSA
jgi:integrase